MAEELVLVERIGQVARLVLNRPEKKNAISQELSETLYRELMNVEADPEVGAVILTGAGDVFCAGADQNDFRAALDKSPVQLYHEGQVHVRLFGLANHYGKPLICAVNGHALAGGLGLVAMCHLAVAAESARFGTTEVKVGLFPLAILPAVRRAIGDRNALALAMTGRLISAREAQAMGLVQEVVPEEAVQQTALALAEQLASFSPIAMRLGLRGFHETADMEFDQAISHLVTLRCIYFGSHDLREGASAFLEKRAPQWQGR